MHNNAKNDYRKGNAECQKTKNELKTENKNKIRIIMNTIFLIYLELII